MTQTICVNPTPVAAFNMGSASGCSPLNVSASNSTNTPLCGTNSFAWSVSYAPTAGCQPDTSNFNYTGGTSAVSANPAFRFISPGTYTIGMTATAPANACSTSAPVQTVVVKSKPIVSLAAIPDTCSLTTINPAATATCHITAATTYSWTFTGGTPNASSSLSPGGIAYNNPGNYTISLNVTNECGSTQASESFIIKPTPDVSDIGNITKCAGQPSGNINFSGSQGGTVYSWTNSNTSIGLATNGTGNIPSFQLTNSGALPITATITVTPTLNGCTGTQKTFTITVNPNPTIVVQSQSICRGQSATLTASGADTYTWSPATGLSATTGNPVTASPTTTTTYTVTGAITATTCSSTATATVTVNPVLTIAGTKVDPNACATATGSITISGLIAGTSGYVLNYSKGGTPQPAVNFSTGAGVTTYKLDLLSAGVYDNITVTLNNCPSNALSFSLTDPNPPATPTVTANGPLCSGATLNLTASTTTGGTATWNWSGPGFSSTDQNPVRTNAITTWSGTYQVTVKINNCTSQSGSVDVVILQTPANPVPNSNSPVCSGNPLTLSASIAGNPTVSWSWTGPNAFSSSQQNPTVSNAALVNMSGTYRLVATANYSSPALNCPSAQQSIAVVVDSTPVITGTNTTNPGSCSSSTGSITLSGLIANSDYQVSYTGPSGVVNQTIRSDNTGKVVITNLPAGSYSNVRVSLNGCPSNAVGPFSLTDPNPPATPVAANSGPVCSGGTLNLSATTSETGTPTWNWTGPNGFSSSSANPSIAGVATIAAGTYSVTLTIANCTSPSATTVVVIDSTPAKPTVTSNSPICSGNLLTLTGSTLSTMPVTWSWTGPNSYSSGLQNPTVSNSATTSLAGIYRLKVTAAYANPARTCISEESTVDVVVKPTPFISGSSSANPNECASSTGSITLNGLTPDTDYEVNYTGPSGAVNRTVRSDNNGKVVITNLPAGSYSNISVTLNGCPSNAVGPFSLTDPNPPPAPVVSDNGPLCSGGTLNLSATTSETGTPTWNWTGPNGFSSSLANPSIAGVATIAAGTYSVTLTIANCTSPSATTVVVVDSTPAKPTVTSNSPVCSGNTLTLGGSTVSTMPVRWSWSGPNGFSSNQANTTVSNTAIVNMSGDYILTAIADYTGPTRACSSLPATITVVVDTTPVIVGFTKTNPNLCASPTGSIQLTGLTANAIYSVSYTLAGVVRTEGITADPSGNVVITGLVAGTYSDIKVKLGNCVSATVGPVTLVDPDPPAAPIASNNTPLCAGNTLNLTATPAAGTPTGTTVWAWSGPGNYSSTEQNPVRTSTDVSMSGIYSVTITVNNCTSPPDTTTVVINPIPDAPAVSTPVVYCQRSPAVALTATATGNNALRWYTAATGGTGSATPPVPSTAAEGTTSYYVSQLTPENCEGARTQIDVIVNPTPDIDEARDTICSGANFSIAPTGTGLTAATQYTWPEPVVTGGLTGGASGNAQLLVSGSLFNPTDFVQTATYRVLPQTGNCPGDSFTVTINVNPAPRVIFSEPDQFICSDGTSLPVTLSSPTPGVTIPWTAIQPAGISGVTTSGTGQIPAQTLNNNTSGSIAVTYKATAVTSGANGCPGAPSNHTITVNPRPLIANQTSEICSGGHFDLQPNDNPPATIVPPGTAYTWTVSVNNNITGQQPQPTPVNRLSDTLVNLSNVPQQLVYTVTPQSGSSGNCTGLPFSLTVTVNPAPVVPALFDTICSGNTFRLTPQDGVPNNATIIPAGTVYNWSAPTVAPGFGGVQSGINSADISGTLTNSTFAPGDVLYKVIPVSGTNGNCPGDTFDVNIRVNPLASINNNPLFQEFCTGGSTVSVDWASFTAGATYSWTVVSSGGVAGFLPAGAGPTLGVMQLTNNGDARDSVVYAVSSTANACSGPPTNYTIYVNPDARARFTYPADTACWPFSIVIQNTSPATANGGYDWYADNQPIGSGVNFPGFTLNGPSERVTIKMVANSLYGCRPDSISHTFYTKPKPAPAFTLSPRDSCGPLQVRFVNNTPLIDTFRYRWDFGNGSISNLAQPGSSLFQPSVFFVDTTYRITLSAFNECVTVDFTDSVIIHAKPKARFGLLSTSGCSPFTVAVSNTSLGDYNSVYYWDFGNGHKDTTTDLGSLQYTYYTNVVDTFPIRLIALNPCGSDTQTINVRVAPNTIRPFINVNATELNGCVTHTVNFVNSTLGATRFEWNFGDGSPLFISTDTLTPVSHPYSTAGTFTVNVSMTNGCSDTSASLTITVYPSVDAAFSVAPIYCMGDTIRPVNQTASASTYQWFWGDGQTSGGADPFHVYNTSGTYNIILRASRIGASGLVCTDTAIRAVNILQKPDVTLQTNNTGLNCAPFTLTASAPGIINEQVSWLVFDTAVSATPILVPGATLQYIFIKPGTFRVKMLAVNAAGCRDSSEINVTVKGTPVARFSPLNVSTCVRDTTIDFLNTSTYNDFGPIDYRWAVDGVNQLSRPNLRYRFSVAPNAVLPRQFSVRLIATNTIGCSDTAIGTVQMNPSPQAAFNVLNPNSCVPYVPIIANGSTDSDRYEWYLNGTLVDTARIPAITIPLPATRYTIRLIVFNQYNCKPDTSEVSFTSRQKPDARFELNDTLGCNGNLNVVTRNLTTNATGYRWDWGDGTSPRPEPNPTHLYNTVGRYLITLVATDGVCNDTASRYVVVSNKPVVDFSADNVVSCDSARVQFTNLTTNGGTYLWTFSNGARSTEENPYQVFAPSNLTYTVTLRATNPDGCTAERIKPNMIRAIPLPEGDFVINPGPVITIPNYSFTFLNTTLNNSQYRYQWDLGDGTVSSSRDVTHKYDDTGSYRVRMIVIDQATGCSDTVIRIARIEGQPGYLYVPNAFYPNSLQNQFRWFRPLGKGLKDYKLQIFDSWGKLLFETTELDAAGSPTIGWDGTFKGTLMPQDAYAWRITATFRNGRNWEGMQYNNNEKGVPGHTFGTVTLFR